jgi:hypothetical protein
VGLVDDEGPAPALAEAAGPLGAVDLAEPLGREVAGVHFFYVDLVGDFGGDEPGDGGIAGAALTADPEGASCQAAFAEGVDSGDDFLLAHHVGPLFRPVLFMKLHGYFSVA